MLWHTAGLHDNYNGGLLQFIGCC